MKACLLCILCLLSLPIMAAEYPDGMRGLWASPDCNIAKSYFIYGRTTLYAPDCSGGGEPSFYILQNVTTYDDFVSIEDDTGSIYYAHSSADGLLEEIYDVDWYVSRFDVWDDMNMIRAPQIYTRCDPEFAKWLNDNDRLFLDDPDN